MKKLAFLLVVVMLVASLAGCGKSDSGVAGSYKLISMTEDGEKMDLEQLEAMAKLMGIEGSLIKMELTKDGKCKIDSAMSSELTNEGTYTVSGNDITLTVEGDPMSGKIDGKKITLTGEDIEMVFEKE